MTKIYLHVGAHKTASSFLQHLLTRDANMINDAGISVVSRKEMRNHKFYTAMKAYKSASVTDFEILNGSFLSDFSNKGSVLFSNEDLLSAIKINSFFSRLESGMEFFCDIFGRDNINVILYTRNQCDYIESCYSQIIHMGLSDSFEEFYDEHNQQILSWDKVIERFLTFIPKENMNVRFYESIKTKGEDEFYKSFLSIFTDEKYISKVPKLQKIVGKVANRSFSKQAVEIFQHAKKIIDKDEMPKLRAFLQNNFSVQTHGKPIFLNERQRAEIKEKYYLSNKKMFELSTHKDKSIHDFY